MQGSSGPAIRESGVARFARSAYAERGVIGYPVRMSDQLVMIHQTAGMWADNLVVVRREDIDGQPGERMEELLREAKPHVLLSPNYDLRSWQMLCAGFAGKRTPIRVMNERAGVEEVGRVQRVDEYAVRLLCDDDRVPPLNHRSFEAADGDRIDAIYIAPVDLDSLGLGYHVTPLRQPRRRNRRAVTFPYDEITCIVLPTQRAPDHLTQ